MNKNFTLVIKGKDTGNRLFDNEEVEKFINLYKYQRWEEIEKDAV